MATPQVGVIRFQQRVRPCGRTRNADDGLTEPIATMSPLMSHLLSSLALTYGAPIRCEIGLCTEILEW